MVNDRLKLPRSSYEELCKIIKAYGHMNKASSLKEVAQFAAIPPTRISANNAFLASIDLIEGGRAKSARSSDHMR